MLDAPPGIRDQVHVQDVESAKRTKVICASNDKSPKEGDVIEFEGTLSKFWKGDTIAVTRAAIEPCTIK